MNDRLWTLGCAMLVVATAGPAHAQFTAQFRPTAQAARTDQPIRVDGELDEAAWKTATRFTGFAETNPGNQTEPAVHSEAWLTHDDENLYVALIAHDDPAQVRVSVTDRDRIFADDYFGIMFDPYGDQTSGYELFVNPVGIQGDLRMLSDGNEDMAFDIIWESHGKVTENGYQVEIAVPFSSLRLPDRREQTWRFNVWRDRQRDVRYQYAWAALNRDDPCFMCQFGTLTGLQVGTAGRDVEVIASVVGTQSGSLADTGDPQSVFDNADPDGDASASMKYAVTSGAFAELAVNPDFSQVESDAGQIDVNNTFALFFPEKRPFFQEGSDLFGTWLDAIYTRSINDPSVAAKMTMQRDATSAVYTFAQDESSPLILPLEERSEFADVGRSWSNILRFQRSLGSGSYLGGLATDRRIEGGGAGTVGGLDGRWRSGSWNLEAQGLLSRTEEMDDPDVSTDLGDDVFGDDDHTLALDGETYSGHAEYLSVERGTNRLDLNWDLYQFSPEFRADNGFVTRNDYRQASGHQQLNFHPMKKWLVDIHPNVGIGRVWNWEGTFKDEWLRPAFWANTRAQTDFGFEYLISRERFGPEVFPGIRIVSGWIDSKPWAALGLGGGFTVGRGIYRDFEDPELANQRSYRVYFDLRPSQRTRVEMNYNFSRMRSREREGEELFSGYILRNRFTVNFTRKLFFRLITQWNDFSQRLDVEPLMTYRINPFTVFYVGSNSRIQQFGDDDYETISQDEWRQTSRQFFAKIQYQFRL